MAGFDQTDGWTTRQLSAGEETLEEEEARWKSAFEEWYDARNIYFRLFTNSEGMPDFRALRGPRGSIRVFRMAAHYRATGEPLDLKLPGFGATIEPKAVYFWGTFAETVSVPR